MKKSCHVPGAEPNRFVFPFAAVPEGTKVLIYGGGIVGKTYVQEIEQTKHCRLVAVADKKPQMVKLSGVTVIKPEEITDFDFELLIIALERQDLALEVWRKILCLGITNECIRWIDPRKWKVGVQIE